MKFYVVLCENDGCDTCFARNEYDESVFIKISDALDLRDTMRKTKYAIQDGWNYTVMEGDTKQLKVV